MRVRNLPVPVAVGFVAAAREATVVELGGRNLAVGIIPAGQGLEVRVGRRLLGRDEAHERHGHVLGRLALPHLLNGQARVGDVRKLGRHREVGRVHAGFGILLADDPVEGRLGAGRVVVIFDRCDELALEVVFHRHLSKDLVGVVGEAAALLLGGARDVFAQDVDEAALRAARAARGARAREVVELVVDAREARDVVRLLGVGVELAICRAHGCSGVVIGIEARDVHDFVARNRVAFAVDLVALELPVVGLVFVVSLVSLSVGIGNDLMSRQVKAQALGAGAANAGLDAVNTAGVACGVSHRRDGDGLHVVGAVLDDLRHWHVTDRLEGKREGAVFAVPAGALDRVPRDALDALGGLDRGVALGVVGIVEDGEGAVGCGPLAVRVAVLDGRDDLAGVEAVFAGVDVDVEDIRAVGHAAVGVGGLGGDAGREGGGVDEVVDAPLRLANRELVRRVGRGAVQDGTGDGCVVVGEADRAGDAGGQLVVCLGGELRHRVGGALVVGDGASCVGNALVDVGDCLGHAFGQRLCSPEVADRVGRTINDKRAVRSGRNGAVVDAVGERLSGLVFALAVGIRVSNVARHAREQSAIRELAVEPLHGVVFRRAIQVVNGFFELVVHILLPGAVRTLGEVGLVEVDRVEVRAALVDGHVAVVGMGNRGGGVFGVFNAARHRDRVGCVRVNLGKVNRGACRCVHRRGRAQRREHERELILVLVVGAAVVFG